jgi:hypothetical protein
MGENQQRSAQGMSAGQTAHQILETISMVSKAASHVDDHCMLENHSVRHADNNRDSADQLERLLQQIDWDKNPPIAPAKEGIIAKTREAQKEMRCIRTEATEHRSNFPPERAAAEALAGDEAVAKVLRHIEKTEARTKVCHPLLQKSLPHHKQLMDLAKEAGLLLHFWMIIGCVLFLPWTKQHATAPFSATQETS